MLNRTPHSSENADGKIGKIPVNRRRISTNHAPQKAVRDSIATSRLHNLVDGWVLDLQASGASSRYTGSGHDLLIKLIWWMEREGVPRFDTDAVRGFLGYVQTAHELVEGRWGEKGMVWSDHEGKRGTSADVRYSPVKPATIKDYYRRIRAFSNWAKEQGYLSGY